MLQKNQNIGAKAVISIEKSTETKEKAYILEQIKEKLRCSSKFFAESVPKVDNRLQKLQLAFLSSIKKRKTIKKAPPGIPEEY